jgi:hypothetical protein
MMRTALVLLLLLPQDDTSTENHPQVRPAQGDLSLWRAGTKTAEVLRKEARVAPLDRLGSPKGEHVLFTTEGERFGR